MLTPYNDEIEKIRKLPNVRMDKYDYSMYTSGDTKINAIIRSEGVENAEHFDIILENLKKLNVQELTWRIFHPYQNNYAKIIDYLKNAKIKMLDITLSSNYYIEPIVEDILNTLIHNRELIYIVISFGRAASSGASYSNIFQIISNTTARIINIDFDIFMKKLKENCEIIKNNSTIYELNFMVSYKPNIMIFLREMITAMQQNIFITNIQINNSLLYELELIHNFEPIEAVAMGTACIELYELTKRNRAIGTEAQLLYKNACTTVMCLYTPGNPRLITSHRPVLRIIAKKLKHTQYDPIWIPAGLVSYNTKRPVTNI